MSEFIKLQILAVIQGIAEFLPVSSSGHLTIFRHWLGLEAAADCAGALEILLHAGTLLALLVFYRRRLLQLAAGLLRRDGSSWRYAGAVVLSAVPAGILYFAAGDWLEALFSAPLAVALLLICTGLMLLSLRKAPSDEQPVTWKRALGIGIAQAIAVLPGISRSGSTYTASRWLKVGSQEAFDFSFIMSIPVIAGAILLKLDDIGSVAGQGMALGLACATVLSAVTGYAALKLLSFIRISGKFHCFGWYCLAAGAVSAIMIIFN